MEVKPLQLLLLPSWSTCLVSNYESHAINLLGKIAYCVFENFNIHWNRKGCDCKMCVECYVDKSRITPLLNPLECLENHTQYICGSCGRCICIERDPNRLLQRWNFPFRTVEIAKLYLRTADYSTKNHPHVERGVFHIRAQPLFLATRPTRKRFCQLRSLSLLFLFT